MNRKNFFKNLTVGVAATFWGDKLKALEEIPVPENPTFKYEEPRPKWNQMSWQELNHGDVIIVHPKVVKGTLLGRHYYITNNFGKKVSYSLIGKSMVMLEGKDDFEYIDITKLETGSFGKICSSFQDSNLNC